MENHKLLSILGRIPLFKDLNTEEKKKILAMPKAYEMYEDGQNIVLEGEQSPYFYILLTGEAVVMHKGQLLATVTPPQFIGEVGFICNEPRIATVTAKEKVMAMKVDKHNFLKLPSSIRETIKDKIIAGLVARLKKVNSTVAELQSDPLSQSTLDEKYAEYELI
ncbi:MAG: cyclic nucleotide-binding domain-containing protein [Aestuariibacter sp.]